MIELLADGEILPVSTHFRCFVYIAVFGSILTAYLSGDNAIPPKVKHAALGFCIFSMHSVFKVVAPDSLIAVLPDIIGDICLC